jgi:glycosyltransferase involved in cell wall biosynthesis
MIEAYLFVDNLRIGGFQRLALDQAYGLSERGYRVTIYVLDELPPSQVPSFLQNEQHLIAGLGIRLVSVGTSRAKQYTEIRKIFRKKTSPALVLSHSLRATFLLRVSNMLTTHHPRLITTIHQLPTLSAPRQRLQRFIYAQFTTELIAYSSAVKADWDARANHNYLFKKLIARKEITVVRNGVYLKRLPQSTTNVSEISTPRLIYLGRNTSWKGVSTFLELASEPALEGFDLLFMIPDSKDLDMKSIPSNLKQRITVVDGKPIAHYKKRIGDVHLYPANYGAEARFVESVSLNCLELACLGVPTLLTKNGLGTWPELSGSQIFHETDWNNRSEIAEEILEISKIRFSEDQIATFKGVIDVHKQITNLINLFN